MNKRIDLEKYVFKKRVFETAILFRYLIENEKEKENEKYLKKVWHFVSGLIKEMEAKNGN